MQRRKFSREFKVEAVRLVRDRGVSAAQAARDLDVHENVLRKWVKEFAAAPAGAFPGHGQVKPEQLGVQPLGVREPADYDRAFEAMTRDVPDAILMVTDYLTILNRKPVLEFAAAHRLPAIFESPSVVRDGGLMSYGPDEGEVLDRVAALVARVLKGATPAELPFERPTKFELAINLKAAKALGRDVPQLLLAQADEVIE